MVSLTCLPPLFLCRPNLNRYHGKCLKIARGKVKEDDKYTCPICDYRVKIPRDATRPKLEDLENWQEEIPGLPFQPEEEDCLARIINAAQEFRSFIASYVNPLLSSPDELTTQRFYLRKLEGADILLSQETNFFRQELHRWAPVAPQPPPKVEVSLSTRKPRPTKQQKMMAQLGIEDPEDLPVHLRTKPHHFKDKGREKRHGTSKSISSQQESHTPPGLPHGYNETTNGIAGPSGTASVGQQHPQFSYPTHMTNPMASTYGSTTSPHLATASSAMDPSMSAFAPHARGAVSPPFQPASPSTAPSNMDPAMFSSNGPFEPGTTSPSRNLFQHSMSSSQGGGDGGEGMRDLFADFTTNDADGEGMGPPPTSHAEDALNLTAQDIEDKEKEEDGNEFLQD